jgi:Trk K+ transport system NAD-binding subunit
MPDLFDYERSRAVLIGTASYRDSRFLPLPAAANSLAGMREVLTDPGLCGWPRERVTVLTDPVDMPQVVKALRRLARDTDEVLLVYFVGHGVILPRGRLCLALADTDADDPDITGLAYEWVRDAFIDSAARQKIAILDCCYSGRAIEALSAEIADETNTRGVYTLTASDHAAHVVPLSEQADAATSFTAELLDLIRTGIPGGPELLRLGTLYLHLRSRLRSRGLPLPNQRGTDTADQFGFTRNAALGDHQARGPSLRTRTDHPPSPAAARLDPGAQPRSPRPGQMLLCGDSALLLRTTEELATRYAKDVTVILPSAERLGPELRRLPTVQMVESADLTYEVLRAAGIGSARALGLLHDDDLGNFHAALRANELNPDLRLVLGVFNTGLRSRVRSFFTDCTTLDDVSEAGPAFAAAALGEPASGQVHLAGRTVYVARRSEVRSGLVVCGLADTREPGQAQLLPDGEEGADLVLAVADGVLPDPLGKHAGPAAAVTSAVRKAFGPGRDAGTSHGPGRILARSDFGLARMSGHVIVVGLGHLGTRIIGHLHDLGHRVVGIDVSEEASGMPTAQRLQIPVVIGAGYQAETLRIARIEHSQAVVCATGSDVANLEIALNARALSLEARLVLRLADDDLADRAERTIGGITALSTVDLAASAFAAAMLGSQVLRTIPVGRHVLLIADVRVDPGSALVGSRVGDLSETGQVRVIGLRRDKAGNVEWMPEDGYGLAAADHLIVLATRSGLGQVLGRSMPGS